MPGQPKVEDVSVVVERDAAGQLKFSLASNNLGNGQRLTFRNNKHPGFDLRFNIDDRAASGCEFLPNPDDAMWVRLIDDITPDPCATCAMHWDGFKAISVINANKTLTVDNSNKRKQKFAFSFRFNVPGEPDPVLYDPIGDNQNGPRQFVWLAATPTIAGALGGGSAALVTTGTAMVAPIAWSVAVGALAGLVAGLLLRTLGAESEHAAA